MNQSALITIAVILACISSVCLVLLYRNFQDQIKALRNENGELMKQIGLLMEANVKKMPARTVEYLEHSQYETFAMLEDLERRKIQAQGEIQRIEHEQERLYKVFDFLKTARTANNNKKEKTTQ